MDLGLIHIYCGDGKGKTTMGVGLSIRAAGYQKKVLYVNFLKNNDSGELTVMQQLSQIDVILAEKEFGFIFQMDEKEKEQARQYYTERFRMVCKKVMEQPYDMLVLDESIASYNLEMIPRQEFITFLKNKPGNLEVVMTGRDPQPELMELADYISDVHMVKHPYMKGVPAREGIEY